MSVGMWPLLEHFRRKWTPIIHGKCDKIGHCAYGARANRLAARLSAGDDRRAGGYRPGADAKQAEDSRLRPCPRQGLRLDQASYTVFPS